jgi:hypothetical protein
MILAVYANQVLTLIIGDPRRENQKNLDAMLRQRAIEPASPNLAQ